MRCSRSQASNQTPTATATLPDSGPTEVDNVRALLIEALASTSVVTTPSAKAPTPPARIAAAIGLSGLSVTGMSDSSVPAEGWLLTVLIMSSLVDRCSLGDE